MLLKKTQHTVLTYMRVQIHMWKICHNDACFLFQQWSIQWAWVGKNKTIPNYNKPHKTKTMCQIVAYVWVETFFRLLQNSHFFSGKTCFKKRYFVNNVPVMIAAVFQGTFWCIVEMTFVIVYCHCHLILLLMLHHTLCL